MQDHNDIYSIVERLRMLEEGLDKNQKSVNQLSATFKPKTVAVLTAKTDPKNPLGGKLVGDSIDNDEEPLEEAITSEDVLDKVKASLADYLKNVADEIKQDSDLKDKKKDDSDIKKKELKDLDLQQKEKQATDEAYDMDQVRRDAEAGVKASLDKASDSRISALKNPPKEKGFMAQVGDKIVGGVKGAAKGFAHGSDAVEENNIAEVKTITNECGTWQVQGDEQNGFEISRGGRSLPSRFKNLEEAEMALEMFANRMGKHNESQDYIDEA